MSDYDMCACDWDEGPSVFRACERSARKRYRCDECDGPILPGERYEYVWGVWEGCPSTFRHCFACLYGPVAFVLRNCGCRTLGGDWLRDHLTTVFHEYRFEHPGVKFRVGRMLVGMRQRSALVEEGAS